MNKKAKAKKKTKQLEKVSSFEAGRHFNKENNEFRFSVNRVKQGETYFYTLSMPSDVLASTCFVTSRYEDSEVGFQRSLDEKKAAQIATYIDSGNAVIPTSVILSSQDEAEVWIDRRKTIVFKNHPKAFLVLDGQHRVWGYHLAKKMIDVPVVIFEKLSKSDEARLFIDINNKQSPVPTSLLLDIKKLANQETDDEKYMREIFDYFHEEMDSVLLGLTDSVGEDNKKIHKGNFNRAFKPLLKKFIDKTSKDPKDVYNVLNSLLKALVKIDGLNAKTKLKRSNYLYAFFNLLPATMKEVRYRFNAAYTTDNFYNVLKGPLSNLKTDKLDKVSTSAIKLKEYFEEQIRNSETW